MASDKIFATERESTDFSFGEATAEVFDDMLLRSVPNYLETQRMITELALNFAGPAGRIYDLGCSTGATIASLAQALGGAPVELIGIDNSEAMLVRAEKRLRELGVHDGFRWENTDLAGRIEFESADVFILNLTLQFVRPIMRPALLRRIHDSLRPGGCLLLVEKVLADAPMLNRLFLKKHLAFKALNGYSQLEIAQKREALENVLVPYRAEENIWQLRCAGFAEVDSFFRWYNFAGFVAVRGERHDRGSRDNIE